MARAAAATRKERGYAARQPKHNDNVMTHHHAARVAAAVVADAEVEHGTGVVLVCGLKHHPLARTFLGPDTRRPVLKRPPPVSEYPNKTRQNETAFPNTHKNSPAAFIPHQVRVVVVIVGAASARMISSRACSAEAGEGRGES